MDTDAKAGASLLFVDDEEVIRKSFARELRLEGFTVSVAADGHEAVSALQQQRFDMVITDLIMAGIDGLGVLAAAKNIAPATSVIILTGYGDMRSAIEALHLGADDYTLKPCEIEDLVFRIRRCLEKRSLLRSLARQNELLAEEITQRQQAEEQLIASEKRFRLALDASSNGVWDRDLVSGEVYFGENWRRTLGYDNHGGNGDGSFFDDLLHPADRERVIALREAHARGETPRYEAEYRIRNARGDWQWILSRGQVVSRDGQGRALRIIGTHTDITRLKDAEAALSHARDQLEERVRERTMELAEANIALSVLLKKREEDRVILAEQVVANTTELVLPYLDKLKEGRLSEQQMNLVDILRANITDLTSPFVRNFSTRLHRLTPTEIQVANLVKLGKRTKEIAAVMHLSPGTISIHRKNIRKKLHLTNEKTNLQSILSLNS